MLIFRTLTLASLWLLCGFTTKAVALRLKFTKVECETYDKAIVTFKNCYLKAVARHKVALYVHAQIHQLPLTEVKVNAALFQKGNGYRPFMYNLTIDACEFLLHPRRFMFWKIIYDAVVASTNLNHSCPYNHDAIIHGLILDGEMLKLVPFPHNDYQMKLKVGNSQGYKAEFRYFVQIYD